MYVITSNIFQSFFFNQFQPSQSLIYLLKIGKFLLIAMLQGINSFFRSFCNNSIISFILFLIGNAWQRFALSGSAVCYLNLNVFIGKIKALFRKRFAHCS